MARVGVEQRVDDRGLGGAVDLADEVVRALDVDLQSIQVERGAVDDGPGRTRRLDGDVEHGVQRLRHGGGGRGAVGTDDGALQRQSPAPTADRCPSRVYLGMPEQDSNTRFVLVQTSHAGNVGAAARAIKVMGFHDLVLVRPRFDDVLSHDETLAMASGAGDVLEHARVVDDLAQALQGVQQVCATAMTPRDFGPPVFAPREHLPVAGPGRRVGGLRVRRRTLRLVQRRRLPLSLLSEHSHRTGLRLAQPRPGGAAAGLRVATGAGRLRGRAPHRGGRAGRRGRRAGHPGALAADAGRDRFSRPRVAEAVDAAAATSCSIAPSCDARRCTSCAASPVRWRAASAKPAARCRFAGGRIHCRLGNARQ